MRWIGYTADELEKQVYLVSDNFFTENSCNFISFVCWILVKTVEGNNFGLFLFRIWIAEDIEQKFGKKLGMIWKSAIIYVLLLFLKSFIYDTLGTSF